MHHIFQPKIAMSIEMFWSNSTIYFTLKVGFITLGSSLLVKSAGKKADLLQGMHLMQLPLGHKLETRYASLAHMHLVVAHIILCIAPE